jgi:hypothetical protein
MTTELFDFGFTAVSESELESVQNVETILLEYDAKINGLQSRLDGVYSSILPLLKHLKDNPDKDYIYWPNRLEKISEFEEKLTELYRGNQYVTY